MRISPRHLLVGMLATSSASQALAGPTVGDTTTQNSPIATDSQNDTTGGLQEVVVTAERREENVQKAPLTIQVLCGSRE
jgi:iron complex outermembrane receptor protein